jgi:hypothetical protein
MHNLGLYLHNFALKGQCHDIFDFRFFHQPVSPKPLSIPLGLFRIFSKICENIRGSRCQICHRYQLSTTPAVQLGKFTAGVVDTVGKFATSVVHTGVAPWLGGR